MFAELCAQLALGSEPAVVALLLQQLGPGALGDLMAGLACPACAQALSVNDYSCLLGFWGRLTAQGVAGPDPCALLQGLSAADPTAGRKVVSVARFAGVRSRSDYLAVVLALQRLHPEPLRTLAFLEGLLAVDLGRLPAGPWAATVAAWAAVLRLNDTLLLQMVLKIDGGQSGWLTEELPALQAAMAAVLGPPRTGLQSCEGALGYIRSAAGGQLAARALTPLVDEARQADWAELLSPGYDAGAPAWA